MVVDTAEGLWASMEGVHDAFWSEDVDSNLPLRSSFFVFFFFVSSLSFVSFRNGKAACGAFARTGRVVVGV